MSSTPTFMFLLHNLRCRWRVLFYTDILYTVYIQRIFYTLSSTAGARCHKICWVIVWVLESGCSGVGEGRTSDQPSGKGWDCQSLLCWAPEVLQSRWQIVTVPLLRRRGQLSPSTKESPAAAVGLQDTAIAIFGPTAPSRGENWANSDEQKPYCQFSRDSAFLS